MDWKDYITSEPEIRTGKPCLRGTRLAVRDIREYLAGGMSVEELLEDFPDLTRDKISACLSFAANRV